MGITLLTEDKSHAPNALIYRFHYNDILHYNNMYSVCQMITYESLVGTEVGVLPLVVEIISSLPPIIIVDMVTGAAEDVFCAPLVSVVWSLFEAPPKVAPSPPKQS